MKKQGNLLYDTTKHTEVSGVMYYNTYTDVNQVAGGGSQQGTPISAHGKVVIQNSGVAGTKSANAGTITANNLIKSVIVQTSTNSDKYTSGIGSNDQSFYDAHNTIKVTVNSKLTDLSTVAGLDTLVQAVNRAIGDNKLWGNDTTYWTANTATSFGKYADANSTTTTSDSVVMGYTRTISASGNYDAHNDRLYAFSWRGDTYLVYDKKAVLHNGTNTIGDEDTIVRLAGVNLDSLKYTVDPEKGTITINDVQFGG